MSYIATFCLVHGFSALLPKVPQDEEDYYEIMNVAPSASQEDIRKAYKKISLQLHPDKVAQRRDSNPEQARAQYIKVQEAHAVLSNPSKRRRYDVLNKSPTRYQFVSTGLNPGAMYENLRKASCCDKSRLVVLAACVCCIILLQPILICSKVNQDLRQEGILSTTSWMIVLIPWWIAYGILVIAYFIIAIITKQVLFGVAFLEHASWLVAFLFLALRWDFTISWDYKLVFIPVYIALWFRWTHKIVRLRIISNNLQRMVTPQHLEGEILGKPLQDLTDEEFKEVQQNYVVVHVPSSASNLENEEERVQSSPEYEHAVDLYTRLVNSLIGSVVVNTTFVALVVSKVDGAISASWWVVFCPLWVSLGIQILASFYTCCCMPSIGDEFIGGDLHQEEEEEANGDDGSNIRTLDPSFESVEGSIKPKASEGEEKNASAGAFSAATNESASASVPPDSDAAKADTIQASDNKTISSSTNVSDEIKEEMKREDLVEDIPTSPQSNDEWSGIHIDDDMYHEFQSAYQEAEESAMEAQAKSQANCCSAVFQLIMLCLLVGKLQRDYMSGSNPGYNAFWILFPVFLIFGCVLCTCACLIYTAGESEGFDHLVERATHKEDEESPAANDGVANTGDAAATSHDEPLEEAKQKDGLVEQDSEIHDLD
jgi:hypothetical protein